MFSRALRPAARHLPRLSPGVSQAAVQRRWASDDKHGSHDSHDSHEPNPAEDTTVRQESFFSPFWRNVFIISALSYGCYAYWPRTKEGETSWLTQAIDTRSERPAAFEALQQRMEFVKMQAEKKIDSDDAQRPPIHRYRNKHIFEQASPYLIPVGTQTDVSNVRIKTREDAFHK